MFLAALVVVLATTINATRAEPRLSTASLSKLAYDEIHKLAILDQIDNYKPPILSTNTRNVRQLNGLYDFCLDPQRRGFDESWPNSNLSLEELCNDDDFYRMPVPSAFNEIPSNSTVKNYVGWFWYQTSFSLVVANRRKIDDQKVYLQFDSIEYLALIWLRDINQSYGENSSYIGSHVGGHLPIVLDISKFVGNKSDFVLTIAISNVLTSDTIPSGELVDLSHVVGHNYTQFQPDFDFFHFAGIMGDVKLIELNSLHIISIEQVDESACKLTEQKVYYKVCLSHKLEKRLVGFEIKLFNGAKTQLLSTEKGTTHNSALNCLQLTCEQCLIEATRERSAKKVYRPPIVRFELRELATQNLLDAAETKLLKLKSREKPFSKEPTRSYDVQLQGFGAHHEQLFSGRTMNLAAIMKDVYLLKRKLGANIIRTSHYPYSLAYLEACDEFKLKVIGECQAVGLRSFSRIKLKLHKQLVREMLQRDHQRSSIVMWSLANEPASQLNGARDYFVELTNFVRNNLAEYSCGRPLTVAIAQSHLADTIGDLFDVIMINRYFGWYDYTSVLASIRPQLLASLRGWHERYPTKGLLISEFGAEAICGLDGEGLYSEQYQNELVLEYERVFDELFANRNETNFLGAMVWNLADFETHPSLLRVGNLNRKGVFTRQRQPKLAAGSVAKVYNSRSKQLGE